MKTRLATLTTILATAALVLTACAGGSGSTTAQSEQTTQETTASSIPSRGSGTQMSMAVFILVLIGRCAWKERYGCGA